MEAVFSKNPRDDRGAEAGQAPRRAQRKIGASSLRLRSLCPTPEFARQWTPPEQPFEIRARAIIALGRTCDARWLDEWTRFALRLAEPLGDADAKLGAAALEALGAVHPADLDRRLAPLTAAKGPRGVKELVLSVIAAPGACR